MKEKEKKKNSTEPKKSIKPLGMMKAYFSMLALTHRNIGALRMTAAYIFIIYALISFWFTITVPVTSEFKPPASGESLGSRLISAGIMIANLFAYGIVMTWKNAHATPLPIRIAFIAVVAYIDISLISRIAYMLIQDGKFF